MASNSKDMESSVKTTKKAPLVNLRWADLALRLVLFLSSAASLATVLTSNQTKLISTPLLSSPISYQAKFTYSSAIVYSVVATSVVCLYSALTMASAFVLSKPCPPTRLLLLLVVLDAVTFPWSAWAAVTMHGRACLPVMAAVMWSNTGAVASIAYIALMGNSHLLWHKICDTFDGFCRHVGTSIALNLGASSVLLMLVLTSAFSLYRRSL